MSNLGGYQVMTTLAKKVGGPRQLGGLILGSGVLLGGSIVAGGIAIKKKIAKELDIKKRTADAAVVYTVKKEGRSNEGLLFAMGDKYKVLETDGDACLIEKLQDNNNPYFVSGKFLSSISDYRFPEGGQYL